MKYQIIRLMKQRPSKEIRKEKEHENSWKKGSSTIEAAFLIPMLLTILLILIYLSFFLYNRLLLTETSYQAALRASQLETATADELYEEAEQAIKSLLSHALLAVSSYQKKIAVQGKDVTVQLEISQQIPFSELVRPFLGKTSWNYSVEKSARQQNPYRFIRTCRKWIGGNSENSDSAKTDMGSEKISQPEKE